MKRNLLALLLAVCLTLSVAVVPAAATGGDFRNDAGSAAQFLKDLNLFKGTDEGFRLYRSATRQEGITLLIRLLGKEEEALSGSWRTPFTDVDAWAKPYVGYAYENGLTNGVSATAFGATAVIDEDQYATFLLRALGYTSGMDFQWDEAAEYGRGLGLPRTGGSFTRGSAVILSRAALDLDKKDGSSTLADALISQGVFTKDEFLLAQEEETAGILAATARAHDPDEARKNAYANFLQTNYSRAPVKLLADLTHDGAPELVVALRKSDPSMPHVTGTHVCVYTYVGGQVKKLREDATTLDIMAGYNGDYYLIQENGKTYLMNEIEPASINFKPRLKLYSLDSNGMPVYFRELAEQSTPGYSAVRNTYIGRARLLGTPKTVSSGNDFAGYQTVSDSLAKEQVVGGGEQTPVSGGDVYTINGVTFRICFPEHWKKLCTIQVERGYLNVRYTRDSKTHGGRLFSIGVETPDTMWETFQTIAKVPNGFLGYETPQDVEFNYNDPISREEFQMLSNEMMQVIRTVEVLD